MKMAASPTGRVKGDELADEEITGRERAKINEIVVGRN